MIIYIGAPQSTPVGAGTYGGLIFSVTLAAAANNVQLVPADFIDSLITVKLTYTYQGKPYQVIPSENLQNLGTFYGRRNNYDRLVNGMVWTPAASGTPELLRRIYYMPFRSPITSSSANPITWQITFPTSAISANIAQSTATYIDAFLSPSTGVARGVPMFQTQVVQVNERTNTYIAADNVTQADFINYDQANWNTPVVSTIHFSSDKISYGPTVEELVASEQFKYGMNIPYQYSTAPATPPYTTGTKSVRALDALPQSFCLFAGNGARLNACVVTLSFNSSVVNASQNYVMWERFVIPAGMKKAAQRKIGSNANAAMKAIANS